jgi:small-conductance mechanosensitive channel
LISLGINLDKFGFIAGALGVGIGFGLQNIVLNFVAGLILAIERPIHIGDVIEVDNYMGRVLDIGVRASKIKTWDGSELIVPNGLLISNKVNNWTLTDEKRRLVIKVSTSFDAEPEKVIAILSKVATEHPEAKDHPAPFVLFDGYGSSSFDFTIYCWVEFSASLKTKSEIALNGHNALVKAGISAPVPLRRLQYEETKKPL